MFTQTVNSVILLILVSIPNTIKEESLPTGKNDWALRLSSSMRMQRYHNIKLMCCIPNLLKSNMVWFESFTKSHMALERWVFVDVLVIVGQCCSPRLIINSRTVDPFYTIFSSVNVCVLKSRLTSISLFLYRLESPSKMTTV